jgi:hypothetical protein
VQSLSILEYEQFEKYLTGLGIRRCQRTGDDVEEDDDEDNDPFALSFCTLLVAFRPGHLGLAISRFIGFAYSTILTSKSRSFASMDRMLRYRPSLTYFSCDISIFFLCFAERDSAEGNSFMVEVLKLIRSTDVIPEQQIGPIRFNTVSHYLDLFVTYHVIRCRPAVFSAVSLFYGEDVAQSWQGASEQIVTGMWECFDPKTLLAYKSSIPRAPAGESSEQGDFGDHIFRGRKARRRDMELDLTEYRM